MLCRKEGGSVSDDLFFYLSTASSICEEELNDFVLLLLLNFKTGDLQAPCFDPMF